MNNIELHRKVDNLVRKNPYEVSKKSIFNLISTNKDIYKYFYSQIDKRWLDWLWEKGFLCILKKKSKNKRRYTYQNPEINYLVRISKKDPARVVRIMLKSP